MALESMYARYNSLHPMISTWWRRCAALVTAVILMGAVAAAADWTQPASKLAREITAVSGPGTASISYRNQSSLPAADADLVRQTLEQKLISDGLRLVGTQPGVMQIRVTFSENALGYVWVAEVQQGSNARVAMVRAARAAPVPVTTSVPSLTLRKTLLWSQPEKILDAELFSAGSESTLLVLDPEEVTAYKKVDGSWQAQQALGIAHDRPWPRDVRGRLTSDGGGKFHAYLPGLICSSSGAGKMTLNCQAGDDPWPLAPGESAFFAPTRNFFTGVLAPPLGKAGSVAPFYSAAALLHPTYTLWVYARTDGTVQEFDGVNDIPLRGTNWGSGVAGVRSACGTGNQLLVSGAGDQTVPDTIRTFEIPDRSPIEAAVPVDFDGPVTALWTAPGGTSAVAVVHNLKSSNYDAFELTITCGQ